MTDQNTVVELTPEQARLEGETLRLLIVAALDELDLLVPLVSRLLDTRQVGLGFATVEALRMQDEMLRKERAARYPGRHKRPVGQTFMRPLSIINASGDRPAPGNLSAHAVLTDVHFVLGNLGRHIATRLREAGVCLVTGLPTEPTLGEMTEALRRLVAVLANPSALDNVAREVERLVAQAKRVVDGDDKVKHPDACPHCGRQTLVVNLTRGVIRCDEDPVTGQLEPCRCKDAYCSCRFGQDRHEWHRQTTLKTHRSWWQLRDLLTITERNREATLS